MKKKVQGRKFGLKKGPRKAMLSSVTRSLILKEKIQTTEAKAKEVSPLVEKMITRAKKGDLASRRELLKSLSPELTKKMMGELAEKYKERKGGYTRVVKLGPRKSDGARMAIVEFV